MKKIITFAFLFLAILSCSQQAKRQLANTSEEGINPNDFPTITDLNQLQKVDVHGIPFGDTILNEFDTERNLGVNNLVLQDDFVLRFTHLARQFARDLEVMGMESCFHYDTKLEGDQDLDNDYRKHQSGKKLTKINPLSTLHVAKNFWAARDCFLQEIVIPEDMKNAYGLKNKNIKAPRVISLFMPNTLNIHLDTNGAWPFGRRPNDNMGNKFTALFLKMGRERGDCRGRINIEEKKQAGEKIDSSKLSDNEKCHIESLNRVVNNGYKGWPDKDDPSRVVPAIPLNPVRHEYKFADGKTQTDFKEDVFPFLLPPNGPPNYPDYKGYYQTVDGEESQSADY